VTLGRSPEGTCLPTAKISPNLARSNYYRHGQRYAEENSTI
jgi:hypothetical protein